MPPRVTILAGGLDDRAGVILVPVENGDTVPREYAMNCRNIYQDRGVEFGRPAGPVITPYFKGEGHAIGFAATLRF